MSRIAALILAAGKGTRMNSHIPKQFLKMNGRAMFLYSVEQYLPLVDVCIVVTGEEEIEKTTALLMEAGYGDKVYVTAGGKERFNSSMLGLRKLRELGGAEYVMIQDAARPMVTEEIIRRNIEEMKRSDTAITAVPSKDTIKIADEAGNVLSTPDRRSLWVIQTPQGFSTELIEKAFENMMEEARMEAEASGVPVEDTLLLKTITDDAMVVETFTDHPVKLVMGDYQNIKVTTPEDVKTAEEILKSR